MDISDAQETIAALYLRLNGYFVSSFIAHAPFGNMTEIDVLAVRFPFHREAEREVDVCRRLIPPADGIDVVIGEVKGGHSRPNFNSALRDRPETMAKVLHRVGAFGDLEIEKWKHDVPTLLAPTNLRTATTFPCLVANDRQVRFVLFAPDQNRPSNGGPVIFGDDMTGYIWSCLRPQTRRQQCDTSGYDLNLWGHQFSKLVSYFKDPSREKPGPIGEIYDAMGCTRPASASE
jgi:hypothetical protein